MARSDRTSAQRGTALITALLTAALLMAIGVTAAEQARMSFLIVHRSRESVEALVAAETGLAVVLADVALEPRFDRFNVDAGAPFPFLRAQTIAPLPASFSVHHQIQPRSTDRVDVVVQARGRNRAGRTLAATIARGEDPYVPAALFTAGLAPSITGSDLVDISGGTTSANPIPAIGGRSKSDADAVHRDLTAAGASLVGVPLAAASAWTDLPAVIERARAAAGVLPDAVDGPQPAGVLSSDGAVEVGSASGSGLWLIDGDLTVRSQFSFEGLLLVLGDIVFDDSSDVRIFGALVQAPPGRLIQMRGDAVVSYRSAPLRELDAEHPEILGRRASVIGWRDDS